MIKQIITYEDYDGETQTEDLYFHLSKSDILMNEEFVKNITNLNETLGGEQRRLEVHEIKRILVMVRELMQMSYGIRSEDGRRFIKKPELWEEFTQTPAYEAFLFSLFEDPTKAYEFITSVFPSDIQGKLKDDPQYKEIMAAVENVGLPEEGNDESPTDNIIEKAPLPDTPKHPKGMTDEALEINEINVEKDPREMTHEELLAAYKEKNAQRAHTV